MKIFISYRRSDSPGTTGRLHDVLSDKLGDDALFRDVESIRLGRNFKDEIDDAVGKCSVLLAVIGPDWLNAQSADGSRRLEDPNDFVRIEITTALSHDIPVIPVLLDGTPMPRVDQLPDDLKKLSLCNALKVNNDSFHRDLEPLERELQELDQSLRVRFVWDIDHAHTSAFTRLLASELRRRLKSVEPCRVKFIDFDSGSKASPDVLIYMLSAEADKFSFFCFPPESVYGGFLSEQTQRGLDARQNILVVVISLDSPKQRSLYLQNVPEFWIFTEGCIHDDTGDMEKLFNELRRRAYTKRHPVGMKSP
jgi:hypothetical protein